MFLFFFIFFTLRAEVVDLVFADSFLNKGDCQTASRYYKKELEQKFQPIIASNFSISLYCLDDQKKAKELLSQAVMQITEHDSNIIEADLIKFNYGLLLMQNKTEYKNAFNVLQSINPEKLSLKHKSLYWAAMCKIDYNKESYNDALKKCKLAFSYSGESCYVKYIYGQVQYELGMFEDAQKLLSGTSLKCNDEDVSYYYALTLYKLGDKQTACKVLSEYLNNTRNDDLYNLIKRELENG